MDSTLCVGRSVVCVCGVVCVMWWGGVVWWGGMVQLPRRSCRPWSRCAGRSSPRPLPSCPSCAGSETRTPEEQIHTIGSSIMNNLTPQQDKGMPFLFQFASSLPVLTRLRVQLGVPSTRGPYPWPPPSWSPMFDGFRPELFARFMYEKPVQQKWWHYKSIKYKAYQYYLLDTLEHVEWFPRKSYQIPVIREIRSQ